MYKHIPRPDNRKVRLVAKGGFRIYSKEQLSQTINAQYKRRFRERLEKLIDCRICVRCKYAFISKKGINICSVCYEDARKEYQKYFMPEYTPVVSKYRQWAEDTGFFPWGGRGTIKPRIPVPNLSRIADSISKTFEMMKICVETDTWVIQSQPRVVGLNPYLNEMPIRDLRLKNAKVA
jgi:hypothetical protein